MQKLILTLTTVLLLSFQAHSQSLASAIVFSENGEKFTASLNGKQMNDTPESRVKMPELNAEFYKLNLDFEDPTIPDFSGNMIVERGKELTYIVKLNRRGKYVIRPMSEAPYSTAETAQTEPARTSTPSTPVRPSPPMAEEPVTEETVTTTTTSGRQQEGVKMDMDVNGTRMSVDVSVPGMEMEETTTVTTTTTTTTKSSNYSSDETVVAEDEVIVDDPYGNCGVPMNSSDFNGAKGSIESKSFADSQLTLAKQIAKSNCLEVNQVKAIIDIFDFEDTKLEFAKFAYDYTVDQNNYYQINDAFDFESTIKELNEYLESK